MDEKPTREDYLKACNAAVLEFRARDPGDTRFTPYSRLLAGLILDCEESGASFDQHLEGARLLINGLGD